jgi:hypothetical protein
LWRGILLSIAIAVRLVGQTNSLFGAGLHFICSCSKLGRAHAGIRHAQRAPMTQRSLMPELPVTRRR